MIVTLLAVLATQSEPRFTMTAEPGDMARAELFEMDGGLTDARRSELLGGAVVDTEISEEVSGVGTVRGIGAIAVDGTRIVLTDAPGHAASGNRVCRITVRPQETANNFVRAARWCVSFFQPTIVIHLPPPPAAGH